jgi:hypothetical protein
MNELVLVAFFSSITCCCCCCFRWLFRLRSTDPVDLSQPDSGGDRDAATDWSPFGPLFAGTLPHPPVSVPPTAPNSAFSDSPVVAGIGITEARRRIIDRLFRREQPGAAEAVSTM